MANVNYSLKNRGVRLISAEEAWIIGRNGVRRLNPKYIYVGKIEMSMPNMVVSASDKNKPKYRADVCELNRVAKAQIVDHFYRDDGKRNKRTVAYLVIEKKEQKNEKKRRL